MVVKAGRHIKFTDNFVILSLLSDEKANHRPVVEKFIDWINYKDMIIDFRTKSCYILPTDFYGQAVKAVQQYNYLRTITE